MKQRVLIIDDDQEMCAELQEILEDEGYHVQTAFDGKLGSELIHQGEFNIVILDLKLPEITGYEVLQRAKKIPEGPRIIILSGRPLGQKVVHDENACMDEEEQILKLADEVINKPVHIPDLIRKIKKAVLSLSDK